MDTSAQKNTLIIRIQLSCTLVVPMSDAYISLLHTMDSKNENDQEMYL